MNKKASPSILVGLEIRKLNQSLIETAAIFLFHCWHECYEAKLPASIVSNRTIDFFNKFCKNHLHASWVAFYHERPVGIICVASNCIDELYVDKKYRRRNIGSALLNTAYDYLIEKQFISAQAGCEQFNESGIAFLQARHWGVISEQTVSLGDGLSTMAIVLAKKLGNDKLSGSTVSDNQSLKLKKSRLR